MDKSTDMKKKGTVISNRSIIIKKKPRFVLTNLGSSIHRKSTEPIKKKKGTVSNRSEILKKNKNQDS